MAAGKFVLTPTAARVRAISLVLSGVTLAISGNGVLADYALADMVPDGTLGSEESVVIPNTTVRGEIGDVIEGGATRGANLFHSFQEFNVGELQRVYFANPSGIENILTRVTGSNISNILGTLGVDGSANLFLLNPNGILFGSQSRLDVAGSFFASDANSLVFGDGLEFSATSPQAPPLLTINITPGLQYGQDDPRTTITNAGNLAVGQDLTLAAGNLDLKGQLEAGRNLTLLAEDTVSITDSVAQPFKAYSGGLFVIQGNQLITIAAKNHVLSGLLAGLDLRLRSANPITGDTNYTVGGNIIIEQLDGNPGNFISPNDPIILANGDVSLGNYTGASLHILAGGSVTVGDIEINSTDTGDNAISPSNSNPFLASLANLTLSDEAATSVVIDGSNRPTLDIRAGIDWTLLGGFPGNTDSGNLAPNFGSAATSANIEIGEVSINAPNGLVLLTNQYQPNPSLVSDTLKISSILTGDGTVVTNNRQVDQSNQRFSGNGGSVFIDYRGGIDISVRIYSSSASGTAGDITLITNEQLFLDGSFIDSNTFGTEKGGDITIDTGSLLATGGAQIETSTFGNADAGKVTIVADDTVTFEGQPANGQITRVFNIIEKNAIGNSGGISITTGSLFVNDVFLQSRVVGQGDGGDITIIAKDQVVVDKSINSIATRVDGDGIGNAGDISIDANSVTITNGARLDADTRGQGNSGNISVTARDTVTIDGVASNANVASGLRSRVGQDREDPRVRNQAQAEGGRGNITIKAKSVFVTNGGQVSTEINDLGNRDNTDENGGNISIFAEDDVIFDGVATNENGNSFSSIIFTRVRPTAEGDGGNVLIDAGSVSFTNGALIISETTGKGNGGDVTINARDRVLFDGVVFFGNNNDTVGSAIVTNVRGENGEGNGGDISITVTEGSLVITEGAKLESDSRAKGDGGDVIISVRDQVLIDGVGIDGEPSRILTGVPARQEGNGVSLQQEGNGGNIEINANSISVTNGGLLDASTSNNGNGGSIDLNSKTLTVNGGVISSAAEETVTGEASDITIDTNTLKVEDGGEITVTSEKGVAGNLNITANSLLLNDGKLLAETQLNRGKEGANITLVSDSIVMLNESVISAEASEQATGGNIDIKTDVLIAFPPTDANGSDIIAKAKQGQGGQITIEAEDVRLIEEREAIDGNRTNDIDASSESGPQGIVTINTGNLDPSRGLDQLPSNFSDLSSLIVASCPRSGKIAADQLDKFIVTGRGGIPPSPLDPIIGRTIIADWVTLEDKSRTETDNNGSNAPSTEQKSQPKRIVEAQGWMTAPDGTIILTSFPTDTTSPPKPWYHYFFCRD